MPGRKYTASDSKYRFGFNGKEKDDEGMGGGGSTYDYGFRISPGFKGDMMGNEKITNINDQHYIDLYLYVLEILKANGNQSFENKTFNVNGSDARIDETENGECVED